MQDNKQKREYTEEQKAHINNLKGFFLDYLESNFDVNIDRNGQFRCISPDHIDNNPSMTINKKGSSKVAPNTTCHCWACNRTFDIFGLAQIVHLRETGQSLSYGQAIKKIEELYEGKTATVVETKKNTFDSTKYLNSIKSYGLDYMRKRGINDFLTINSQIKFSSKKNSILIPVYKKDTVLSYTERFVNVQDKASDEVRYKHIGGMNLYDPIPVDCNTIVITEGEIDALSINHALGWGLNAEGKGLKVIKFNKSEEWLSSQNKQLWFPLGEPQYDSEPDDRVYKKLNAKAIGLGSANNINLLISAIKNNINDLSVGKNIIIALDNDKTGIRATEELKQGLNELGCKYIAVNLYGEMKDANEALLENDKKFANKLEFATLNFNHILNNEIDCESIFNQIDNDIEFDLNQLSNKKYLNLANKCFEFYNKIKPNFYINTNPNKEAFISDFALKLEKGSDNEIKEIYDKISKTTTKMEDDFDVLVLGVRLQNDFDELYPFLKEQINQTTNEQIEQSKSNESKLINQEDKEMALNKKDDNLTKLASEIVAFYKKTNQFYNVKNESEEVVNNRFNAKITRSLMNGDIGYIKDYVKRYIEKKVVGNQNVDKQTKADALSIVEGLDKMNEKTYQMGEVAEDFKGSSEALKEFLSIEKNTNISSEQMKAVVIENYKNMIRGATEENFKKRIEYLIFKSDMTYNHFSELNKDLLYAQCSVYGFIPLCDNFNALKKQGLNVNKGSQALKIIQPLTQKYYFDENDKILPLSFDKEELALRDQKVENGEYTTKVATYFRTKACEFSISQTDIKEEDKPKIFQRFKNGLTPEEEQEASMKYEALLNLSRAIGFPVKEEDFKGNESLGFSADLNSNSNVYKGVIHINKDQPIDAKFSSLAHELGHSLFHRYENKIIPDYRYSTSEKEVQAEQFSNMVCAGMNVLTTKSYSEKYIQSWLHNGSSEEQINEAAEKLYGHTRVVDTFQKLVQEGCNAYLNDDKIAFDNCVQKIKEESPKRFFFNQEKQTGIVVKEETVSMNHTNTTIAEVVKNNDEMVKKYEIEDNVLKGKIDISKPNHSPKNNVKDNGIGLAKEMTKA